jgi:hypothetical protein
VRERMKQHMKNADSETIINQIRKLKEQVESKEEGQVKRIEEFRRKVEQAMNSANAKIKSEFTFK